MIYIIGCGGVGSWLAAAMVRLSEPENVTLVDGDTLEEKNLDRQLFNAEEIGQNKAEALARRYGCRANGNWYDGTTYTHRRHDILMCCADNNTARFEALKACDLNGCCAIIGANETHSSEAYFYTPIWSGTANDPRVYYPEIVTDKTNNPAQRGIGCTGEAQAQNRQLVTANFMAAAMMGHLYVVWAMESRRVSREVQRFMPHRLHQNLTRSGFTLSGEPNKVEEKEETNAK